MCALKITRDWRIALDDWVNNKMIRILITKLINLLEGMLRRGKMIMSISQSLFSFLCLHPHPRRMRFVREHLLHAHTMKARDRARAGIYFWIMQRRLSSAIGEKEIRPLYATHSNFVRWNYFPFLFQCEIAPGSRRSTPYRDPGRIYEIIVKY